MPVVVPVGVLTLVDQPSGLPLVVPAALTRPEAPGAAAVRAIPSRVAPNGARVEPVLPVVREQVVREMSSNGRLPLSAPRPVMPPSVAATPAQPAIMSLPRRVESDPAQAPVPTTVGPVIPAVNRRRESQPSLDIDRIVDRVHKRFLQRLAVEGERRGVR